MTTTVTSSDAAQSEALREPVHLDDYQRAVGDALTRVFEHDSEEHEVDLNTTKIIVFSDHHKGSRDGADDFRGCERAYAAALAYYLEEGFRLIALGDVEELWECSPNEVVKAYPEILELEGEFHAAGRYDRLWGNHDLQWSDAGDVAKYLQTFYPGLHVREALKLRVVRGGERLGLLFFAHGHQGTLDSDRWAWLSKPVVRHVWRPLQRRLNMRSTNPSRNFQLRQRHDEAMFSWARNHPQKPVLIAGHTHRPVFWTSQAPVEKSEAELAQELETLRASEGQPDVEKVAELHARLEYVRAERREKGPPPIAIDPPCYFNTGCCSFGDGDVTGIEIAEGEIRLVRWPDDQDDPVPKRLVKAKLAEVFERVAGAGGD
jgi:Calcineurin-like phosphoesterase